MLSLLNTGMGLPPVAAGLFLYLFLSRSGALGFMGCFIPPPREDNPKSFLDWRSLLWKGQANEGLLDK